MKLLVLLALAPSLPAVLGTPSPLVEERQVDSSCNPYNGDWGHVSGANAYYCANINGDWWNPDFHCVSYKEADYCSGKNLCDASNPCDGNQICLYGICVREVNGKQCQRTCSNGWSDSKQYKQV